MVKIAMIFLMAVLCSCGALRKTKKIDRVKTSAQVEFKSDATSASDAKVEDKSIRTEKSSERGSEDVITTREIFFDEKGNVNYIIEKKTESRNRDIDKEVKDSLDVTEQSSSSGTLNVEGEMKLNTDSLKKDTQTEQPENSVWSWIGAGILIVFAAVALVVFIRFRK